MTQDNTNAANNHTANNNPLCMGMDVGGSHVTVALHEARSGALLENTLSHQPVDSSGPAEEILATWTSAMRATLDTMPTDQLQGIGIAMPGPFDYDQGISRIRGLAKYESIYGMNIRKELKARLNTTVPILFRNDAACFTLGECWSGAARDCQRVIGITLGTGLGSAFIASGDIIDSGPEVPPHGWLYQCDFQGMIAEEWFSGRGLLRIAAEEGAGQHASLRDYAEAVRAGNEPATAFERYGRLMGEFLSPWIEQFSRSLDLFGPSLRAAIATPVDIRPSLLLEHAALAGAASLPLHLREPSENRNE